MRRLFNGTAHSTVRDSPLASRCWSGYWPARLLLTGLILAASLAPRHGVPAVRAAGIGIIPGMVSPATILAARSPALGPNVLGMPASGGTEYTFTERVRQTGDTLEGVGYLTDVAGLSGAPFRLVASPSASPCSTATCGRMESTALFTFVDTLQVTQRIVNGNLFILDYSGSRAIYVHPITPTTTITFTNPLSFAQDTLVARQTVQLQDVLTVIAPNTGLFSGTAVVQQLLANPFTLGGKKMQLGRVGARGRAVYAGSAQRLSLNPLSVTAILAGYQTALP